MREGLLTLLFLLAAATGVLVAQPVLIFPEQPNPATAGPEIQPTLNLFELASQAPALPAAQPAEKADDEPKKGPPVTPAQPGEKAPDEPKKGPPVTPAPPIMNRADQPSPVPVVPVPQRAPYFPNPRTSAPAAGPTSLPDGAAIAPIPEPDSGSSSVQCAQEDGYSDLFWFSGDYLLWWTKNGPISAPLITQGSLRDNVPGAFGQPNTVVLSGNQTVDFGTASGMRFDAGFWLDREHRWAVEGNYFRLEQRSNQFATASDANGNPILGQPIINAQNNLEQLEAISIPTALTGSATVTALSRLQGWEANVILNVMRSRNFSFELLSGFRAVELDEDLQIGGDFSQLQNGFITFLGQGLNGQARETTLDSFSTQNRFYGGQVGGRFNWMSGRWNMNVSGKIAAGDNQQLVRINGASTLLIPGQAPVTVPGGVLAVATNSGRFFRNEFSLLPEAGVQVGYQFTDHLEGHVGYSFLYMTNVVRPGSQIDRVVNPVLVPTDPIFGTAAGTRPIFQFRTTDYWAQGANFGLSIRY